MLDEFKSWSDDMSKFIGGARNDKHKYEKGPVDVKMVSSLEKLLKKEGQLFRGFSNGFDKCIH